jgi:serine/threonine protein kinase
MSSGVRVVSKLEQSAIAQDKVIEPMVNDGERILNYFCTNCYKDLSMYANNYGNAQVLSDTASYLCQECAIKLANNPIPHDTGDYILLQEFGHGAMGIVYKAWQRSTHRIVALKKIAKKT